MSKELKLSSFYGARLARPYIVLDEEGKELSDRVDPPRVNDALIAWGSKVPFKAGGLLVKPRYTEHDLEEGIPKPLNDFQLFIQERREDILAADPILALESDPPAFLAMASAYWKEKLTDQERQEYQSRATEMREKHAAAIEEREVKDPQFKKLRDQLKRYKKSVSDIISAAKEQAGPLWKIQRRKYRKLKSMEGTLKSPGSTRTKAVRRTGAKSSTRKARQDALDHEPVLSSSDSEDEASEDEDPRVEYTATRLGSLHVGSDDGPASAAKARHRKFVAKEEDYAKDECVVATQGDPYGFGIVPSQDVPESPGPHNRK